MPKIGTDSTLDIANWNIEWLGDSGNGPTNEKLQLSNAVALLTKADIDLWGLCEISTAAAWDSLLARMPAYGGAISTWSQPQKTALLFRKSMFTLLYQQHILAVYEREFASGRLPLEVALETTAGGRKDTLYIIVIHLKANTGNTTEKNEAWDLRKRSSEALKGYLDLRRSKKYIVLGDWNDDVDKSIWNNLATPFSKILADTGNYTFTTAALSAAGQRSTTSYSEMIDHQMVNKSLSHYYVASSAAVLYAGNYITGYSSNTSDHYPVYSRFDMRRMPPAVTASVPVNSVPLYFDGKYWYPGNGLAITGWKQFALSGQLLHSGDRAHPLSSAAVTTLGVWILEDGRVIRRLIPAAP